MGVYIKGMRMPKGCYDPLVAPSYCFLLRSGTCKICHEYADKHGELCMEYPIGCSLVEVKDEPTEITYQNCSDALLKMWMDNVLTDAEYNRIMGKLNKADRKTENSSEKPNNCEVKNYCDDCLYTDTCDSKEFFYACTSKATISKMEQVDKDINVRSKD